MPWLPFSNLANSDVFDYNTNITSKNIIPIREFFIVKIFCKFQNVKKEVRGYADKRRITGMSGGNYRTAHWEQMETFNYKKSSDAPMAF